MSVMMVVAGWAPGSSEFFQLDLKIATACAIPPLALGSINGFLWNREHISIEIFHGSVLVISGLLKFFAGALVALSSPQGAVVMAAVLILTASYHGHLFRSSLSNPLEALVCVVSLVAAMTLNLDSERLVIYAVVCPMAPATNRVFGTFAMGTERERVRQKSLLEAVQAQILDERSRRADELSDVVTQILQSNHDAANAVHAALAGVEQLRESRPDEVNTLVRLLERTRGLLGDVRQLGHTQRSEVPKPERVDLVSVAKAAAEDTRLRYPSVEITCELSGTTSHDVFVTVSGGASNLARVIENLLVNACQGNEAHGASHVRIAIEVEGRVNAVRLLVEDNGPGFSLEQLARSITGFDSQKPGGLGLGLYTVERLIRASGGSLRRENREAGGARVSIFLAGGAAT